MTFGARTGVRALALVLALFATACARRRRAPEADVASYGPRDVTPPPGAVVARDEAELVRLVADPAGPRDVWLEPRRYATPLVIRRSLALHGRRGARISGPGRGTVVTIAADDVVLEDVAIDGAGPRYISEDSGVKAKGSRVVVRNVLADRTLFGVVFEECHACTIEGTLVRGADVPEALRGDGIKLWEAHDSLVRRNRVEDARDVVVWYSRAVHLDDNVVTRCRYGTHFMYAHDSFVENSRLVGDVVGIFVMYSERLHAKDNVIVGSHGAAGIGIGFKESDAVRLDGNVLVGNTTGLYLDRSPRDESLVAHFDGNVIGANDVALRFHGANVGQLFRDNSFEQNRALLDVEGGGDALGATFEGNYWSDYDGYDLDGDGRGDLPFEYKQLSSELEDTRPSIRYFRGTLAVGMIDAVSRAFPILQARTLLVDRAPAMHRAGGEAVQRRAGAIARSP